MSTLLSDWRVVFSSAIFLRVGMFYYGLYQDAHSPMKYTDIDYYVFTDAARFIAHGRSPYARDTYRYTPLLAWLLLPTAWQSWWFSFGKVVFAAGDIVAGWLIVLVLRSSAGMTTERAVRFASIWLLNPMVATISTRGSSEGLLGVMVIALLWAVTQKKIVLAGVLLGLAVHFKIYPFIYAPAIIWWLDDEHIGNKGSHKEDGGDTLPQRLIIFFNSARITLAVTALSAFILLNLSMYTFSSPSVATESRLESIAFFPQLFLSAFAIPLALAKRDLPSTMLAQTFAFVTFNKVCTSQYFLWYMVFLPFYLPKSLLLEKPSLGGLAGAYWILTQAAWLQQGYELEFLGNSTFIPGLWVSSLLFFLVNVWILGIVVSDVASKGDEKVSS
ncbi:MAG: GPI mannosyltransferase 1 [Pycnora praestabilis]|nr:MAG: GPI mannosyltransferase 1 [Pycnora praestabilis]